MHVHASNHLAAVLFSALLLAGCGGGNNRGGTDLPAADSKPDSFAFDDLENAAPGLAYVSNEIAVSGINVASDITVTGGEISIDGGAFSSGPSVVEPGHKVRVRAIAPESAGTTSSAVVTIGGVSDAFEIAAASPNLNIHSSFKTLTITWASLSGVTDYRVLSNPDGNSGFSNISGTLDADETSFSLTIPAHQYNWNAASFALEACNDHGCAVQTEVADLQPEQSLQAIGRLKSATLESNSQFGGRIAAVAAGGALYSITTASRFSRTLAMSSDGSVAAIALDTYTGANGNDRPGKVALYQHAASGWSLAQELPSPGVDTDSEFGTALALSANGGILVVGDDRDGAIGGNDAAYVYVRGEDGVWEQVQMLQPVDDDFDSFGSAVAVTPSADLIVVGARTDDLNAASSGAAYVYKRNGDSWEEAQFLKSPVPQAQGLFGATIAVSADGLQLFVAAPNETAETNQEGSVYHYSRNSAAADFVFHSRINLPSGTGTGAVEYFGSDMTTNAAGNLLAVGGARVSSNQGVVAVFGFVAGNWEQQGALLTATNADSGDYFGGSLALSADGTWLAVGAPNEDGAARGIAGDSTDNSGAETGAVYVFDVSGPEAHLINYVKAPTTRNTDHFGYAVALSGGGDTLLVSAPGDDSAAAGFDADPGEADCDDPTPENCVAESGAVFVY